MIGSFILDDYYFFFDTISLYWLNRGHTRTGSFVCYSNTLPSRLIRMSLTVAVDHGTEKNPPDSSIEIDFKHKVCTLKIGATDFNDWFVTPNEHTREEGPNWRFASSNVYIKTELSNDYETFRRNIENTLSQVPEKRHPRPRTKRK